MLRDRVLFTGTSFVAHPVVDRLFGGYLEPQTANTPELADHILVVIDARLGANDLDENGVAYAALRNGVPVLVLSPNEGQLEPLASLIGVVPKTAAQAVLIAPNGNRKEPSRFEATMLAYPARLVSVDEGNQENVVAAGNEQPPKKSSGCGCGDAASPDSRSNTVLSDFVVKVESRTTKPFSPQPLAFPDGLKYFQTTWNPSSPFTSSGCDSDNENCFANGQGSLGIAYVVWGFLSQSATSSSQYLVIEGNYSVYPGSLDANDDETRGYLNVNCQSSVGPTSGGFSATNHIPTNGVNSWNESFTLNISYRDPIGGGYQIYQFTATVTQSIDSWSVQDASAAPKSGSLWFVNSPMNGSNIGGTYGDAFSGSGHVEAFPSASTGTLSAKEASAWQTNQIQSGNITVAVSLQWKETVFYATSCGLLFCYWNGYLSDNWSWNPSFTVNFSSIIP